MGTVHKRLISMKNGNKTKCAALFLLMFFSFGIIIYFKDVNNTTTCLREIYCPTDNIITVREGGRLGNCVWEYVFVLGIGETLGYNIYIPKNILDCLSKVFKNLRIPAYEDTLLSDTCRRIHGGNAENCMSKDQPPYSPSAWDHLCYTLKYGPYLDLDIARKPVPEIKSLKDSGELPTNLILPPWGGIPHALDPVGPRRFKEVFQLRDDVKELAMATLNGVKKRIGSGDQIFVGVHVRRTDYPKLLRGKKHLNVSLADLDYYKRAMSRMHSLYDYARMVFVVVSDDYEWCKNNLVNERNDVYWGGLENSAFIDNWKEKSDMSVFHDLAVLSLQNHTIIAYGTYGTTGSLLSGGHTIVTNISRYVEVKDDFATHLSRILPNWEQL